MGFLGNLFGSDDNDRYSSDWFNSASDDELREEREKVRQEYSHANTLESADKLFETLDRFDDEMSKRAWGDETPRAPSFHREHGWYLPNDDD